MTQAVRTALITGGAKRIGKALVEALHQQGMNVVFQYHRSEQQAEQILGHCNQQRPNSAIKVKADLQLFSTYRNLVDQTLTHFGQLDILINNAAGFFPTPFENVTEDNWNELITINTKAPFFLARECYQSLKKSHGCIINITDIYADRPLYDYSVYSASKAALTNLTLSMARSFAPDIRVNAVAPGAILPAENENPESMQAVVERTPLEKLGGTQAIVETILFLVNDASFITGQVINVDGGRSAVNA